MTSAQKWAELLHHIEEQLNKTGKRGYSSIELMFREKKQGIFDKMLSEVKHNILDIEDLIHQIGRSIFKDTKESCREKEEGRK